MPKQLTLASGAATKTWAITSISIVPPTLPGTVDGSVGWTMAVALTIDDQAQPTQSVSDGCSAAAFHAVWDDVGARLQAALAASVTHKQAFYVALRDALYAYSQRDGGPIPTGAA